MDGLIETFPVGVEFQVPWEDPFLEEGSVPRVHRGKLDEPELSLQVMDGRGDGGVPAMPVGSGLLGRFLLLAALLVVSLSSASEGVGEIDPLPE